MVEKYSPEERNVLENELKYLMLFDKKSRELLESEFSKALPGSKVKLNLKKEGKGATGMIQRWGPNNEAIKSFAVTFRNFVLNEEISIRNIATIYNKLSDDNLLKIEFNETRKNFNDFLNSPSTFMIENKKLTNKELLDTYLHGDIIHFDKIDQFETWHGWQPSKEMVLNEIVAILGKGANFIYHFEYINHKYLEKIE